MTEATESNLLNLVGAWPRAVRAAAYTARWEAYHFTGSLGQHLTRELGCAPEAAFYQGDWPLTQARLAEALRTAGLAQLVTWDGSRWRRWEQPLAAYTAQTAAHSKIAMVFISAENLTALRRAVQQAATLPGNQVQFAETAAEHLRRLTLLAGVRPAQLRIREFHRRREQFADWWRGLTGAGYYDEHSAAQAARLDFNLAVQHTPTAGYLFTPEDYPPPDPELAAHLDATLQRQAHKWTQRLLDEYLSVRPLSAAEYQARQADLVAAGLWLPAEAAARLGDRPTGGDR